MATSSELSAIQDVKRRGRKVLVGILIALAISGSATPCWAQTKIPRIGIPVTTEARDLPFFRAFERALAERGWVPGKNVVLEYAVREGDWRQTEAVDEVVRLKVDVIYASSAPTLHAAYAATHTIPIVAQNSTTDPVAVGLQRKQARHNAAIRGDAGERRPKR
jgi:putative ABC transport system substrate-binding protein